MGGGVVVRRCRAAEAGGESTDTDLNALLEIASVKHEEKHNQRGKVAVATGEQPSEGTRLFTPPPPPPHYTHAHCRLLSANAGGWMKSERKA